MVLRMKPKTIKIYSENNDFQHVETLRRRREKRLRHREFFVEGVRPINQALKHRQRWAVQLVEHCRGDQEEIIEGARDGISKLTLLPGGRVFAHLRGG